MSLREPIVKPHHVTEKAETSEGNDWPKVVTGPIPKTAVIKQRGEGPIETPRRAEPPARGPLPHRVFFLFCLQIERTGLRCPCPTAVFMAA